jgi:HK97 family phage portal protein
MNPFATLAKSTRTLRQLETRKANPSQALGGIIIPPTGSHSQVIDVGKDPNELVLKGWKANVFAYTCVKRLAGAVAQVTWRVERRTGEGEKDWEPVPGDWRNKLLAYPMGSVLSAYEVFFHWAAWIAIKGNGLLRKTLGGPNGIIELVPMSPKNISPVPDRELWCSGYNLVEDGKIIWNFPAEEIIHARLPDPTDPLWGYGMLEAAFPYIVSENASRDWRSDLYTNGGVPPAAIIDEELTPTNVQADQAALSVAFRRNAKNRVPMLMGGKKTLLEFGFSPADMAIPDDRELTRNEIVLAFGMLPAMFSTDAATYDNQDGAIRYMYENGAGELLALMREALNLALLTPEERESDSVYINFDLSEIPFFRRQKEARLKQLGEAIANGVSRNDGVNILDLGLEDAQGGDEVFVSGGLVLLSEAAQGLTSTDAASFNADPMAEQTPSPVDIGAKLPQAQDVQVTQDAVLNGAQITAATAIVQAVAVGDLPRDAGIGQLMVLFNLEQSQAELMMGTAGNGFVAQSTVALPPPMVPSVPPPAE